ncbi:hypothetical protein LRS13_08330 [Svornostia abyssi]|uniref:Uncharacterized protein n=1 Tax=Svornostia abyssi TaxID=2898438 RepID=A0ABY5PM70_9ACTN|nr:hypothetical protein LRS13_08330 [Parviterribacteraceae bacterium J379]
MLSLSFRRNVTRLDAGTLTTLMSALLTAEAARLNMPPNAVVVSQALNDADGGLDARIDEVPVAPDNLLPSGLVGFQFKARKSKTFSNEELRAELAKPGPTRILQQRGTYVLVVQADLNDQQRSLIEQRLAEEASLIAADPQCLVWDATAIEAFAQHHVAVVEGLELESFEAVRALPEIEQSLRIAERPYEADDRRREAIEQIRSRATGSGSDELDG